MGNILRRFLYDPFMNRTIRPILNFIHFFKELLLFKRKRHPQHQFPALHDDIDHSPN